MKTMRQCHPSSVFEIGASMTLARKMLLESLVGHFALLGELHPKKAAAPMACRAKRYVRATLKGCTTPPRGRRIAA